MANTFKSFALSATTAAGTVYTCPLFTQATVIGLNVANTYTASLNVNVTLTKANGVSTATLVGGTGYTNGTYTNVPLTGSATGVGATANITVAGGIVTVVTIVNAGSGYKVGDVLTAGSTYIGAGTSFTYTVSAIANKTIYLSYQDPIAQGGSLVIVGGDQKLVLQATDYIQATVVTASGTADVALSVLEIA